MDYLAKIMSTIKENFPNYEFYIEREDVVHGWGITREISGKPHGKIVVTGNIFNHIPEFLEEAKKVWTT